MRHCTIYWRINDPAIIKKIRDKFGLPKGMTVNGVSEGDVKDEDWDLFKETEKRGFLQVRRCEIINNNSNEQRNITGNLNDCP